MPDADLVIMRRLDRLHLEYPFAGSRMLRGLLAAEGCNERLGARFEVSDYENLLPCHDQVKTRDLVFTRYAQ